MITLIDTTVGMSTETTAVMAQEVHILINMFTVGLMMGATMTRLLRMTPNVYASLHDEVNGALVLILAQKIV